MIKKTGAGAPRLYAEKLRNTSVRLTEGQLEKLLALGGAKWIRDQLDATPKPRKPRA